MRWIRLHNDGDFDVVTAIQMIGASVKTNDDPIGLYGSGVKYALAQALRMGINVKIAVNGKMYSLAGKKKEFRGEEFTNVALKEQTGRMHVTSITSEFGKEDWTEKWFIFREFYSNTLDEQGTMTVVEGLQTTDGVEVFLPYHHFEDMAENIGNYFTDREWSIREGSGRVFKRGVYIGTVPEECEFDMQSNDFGITEVRTMEMHSVWWHLSYLLRNMKEVKLWELLFNSPKIWDKFELTLNYMADDRLVAFKTALVNIFGKDYAICPSIDWIVKDALAMGFNPVIFPDKWTMPKNGREVEIDGQMVSIDLAYIQDMCADLHYRETTANEAKMIDRAITRLGDFIPAEVQDKLNIRIFKADIGILGNNKLGTTDIGLNEATLATEKGLLKTLLHEVNHIRTQAKDYTREFETGYADFIVELMM
jgi:hypothetical protein